MSFLKYVKKHYVTACALQRDITRDPQIITMLQVGKQDVRLVKAWMQDYGLFQGISASDRNAIAKAFLKYAKTVRAAPAVLDARGIERSYRDLFLVLYRTVNRSWMSATSKLLWRLYPNDIVIADTFVHRALLVLQCVDDDLASFPRIGIAQTIRDESDIESVVAYYMSYQAMVKHLQKRHQVTLDKLRQKYSERYEYDIRIMDKLLWMIGNPRRAY